MSNKFGFLAKLNFLQDWTSYFISKVNPAIIHNLEKYLTIKKVHYLSSIEDIEGDYIEFGVFTGSSFAHSIRCCKNMLKYNKNLNETKFIGFDSFEGFGEIDKIDEHPHGKGIFKIDPSYRFLIIGFSIPLFIFSLILLKIKK